MVALPSFLHVVPTTIWMKGGANNEEEGQKRTKKGLLCSSQFSPYSSQNVHQLNPLAAIMDKMEGNLRSRPWFGRFWLVGHAVACMRPECMLLPFCSPVCILLNTGWCQWHWKLKSEDSIMSSPLFFHSFLFFFFFLISFWTTVRLKDQMSFCILW